jgi:hypothetical protein
MGSTDLTTIISFLSAGYLTAALEEGKHVVVHVSRAACWPFLKRAPTYAAKGKDWKTIVLPGTGIYYPYFIRAMEDHA